ncbi:hypothetical protein V8C35DRAFT_151851 [Trichoderma chlorosporum]
MKSLPGVWFASWPLRTALSARSLSMPEGHEFYRATSSLRTFTSTYSFLSPQSHAWAFSRLSAISPSFASAQLLDTAAVSPSASSLSYSSAAPRSRAALASALYSHSPFSF